MIYRSLFVPLGVDSTPLGMRKQIAAAVPIIAAAGASLLGSLINSSSQAGANETNLQMVRETNEANKKMTEDTNRMSQVQFDRNMNWMQEQYYDTEQYKRTVEALKKAGLNPALALGNASPVGSVGAPSQSSFHTAQMEAGHVEPVRYGDALSEPVGSAINAYYQNQLLNSQAENIGEDTQTKRINNATQAQRNMLEIHNLYEDVQNKLSQRGLSDEQRNYYSKLKEQLSRQIDLFNDTYEDLSKREKYQNDVLNAQKEDLVSSAALKRAQSRYQDLLVAWYPSITQSQLQVASAQFNDLVRSAELKVKEGQLKDAESVSKFLQNGLDSLEFQKELKRHKTHNSNKATRVFYGTLDEIGHTLFSNLRLFGK